MEKLEKAIEKEKEWEEKLEQKGKKRYLVRRQDPKGGSCEKVQDETFL